MDRMLQKFARFPLRQVALFFAAGFLLTAVAVFVPTSRMGVALFWPVGGFLAATVALGLRVGWRSGAAGSATAILAFGMMGWKAGHFGDGICIAERIHGCSFLFAALTLFSAWLVGMLLARSWKGATRGQAERLLLRFSFTHIPLVSLLFGLLVSMVVVLTVSGDQSWQATRVGIAWALRDWVSFWLMLPLSVLFLEGWYRWPAVRRQVFWLAVTGTGGLALTWSAFLYERSNEYRAVVGQVHERARLLMRVLGDNLEANQAILVAVGGAMQINPEMTAQEYSQLTRPIIDRWKGITALSWGQLVRLEEKEAYEQQRRGEGIVDFVIHERDEDRTVMPVREKAFYVPVHFAEPAEVFPSIPGFDLTSESRREAAYLKAIETGEPAMTARVVLKDGEYRDWAVLLVRPVFDTNNMEPNEDRILGFISLITRINRLFRRGLGEIDLDGMAVRLLDITEGQPPERLFQSPETSEPSELQAVALPGAFRDPLTTEYRIADRTWRLEVAPSFGAIYDPREPITVSFSGATEIFLFGVGFTGILGQILLLLGGRTAAIEQTVRRRTRQIRAVNRRLEDESAHRIRAEDELRRSEALFRDLAESSPVGIFLLDDEAGLLYANRQFARMLGERELSTGDHGWMSRLKPVEHEQFADWWAQAAALPVEKGHGSVHGRYAARVEVACPPVGGVRRWGLLQIHPRSVGGWVGSLMDTTEMRQAMQAAILTERHYRQLLDAIPEFIVQFDSGLNVQFANDAVNALMGGTGDDGPVVMDQIELDGAIRARLAARIREVFRTGQGQPLEWEHPDADDDGHVHSYQARFIPERGPEDQAERVLVIVRDVTAQRAYEREMVQVRHLLEERVHERTEELAEANRALIKANNELIREVIERGHIENALRENERFIQEIVQATEGLIYIYDIKDQCLLFYNQRTRELLADFGFSSGYLPADRLLQLIHPDFRDLAIEHRERFSALEDGVSLPWECRLADRDQGQRWFQFFHRVFERSVDGTLSRILGTAIDVTAQREAEMAARRSERLASIGTLAAGIAHEINNPLATIMITSHDLKMCMANCEQPNEWPSMLQEIIDSTRRCSGIVKRVLTFARSESGTSRPESLATIVEQATKLVGWQTESGRCELVSDLPDDLPPVQCHAGEIEQVMVNLIQNSIQAGSSQVTITAQAANDRVTVSVIDNGGGMTDRQARHAFDPFFTGRQSRGGTGLGLSICHGIVSDHGGRITIERTGPKGTHIQFSLARATENGQPTTSSTEETSNEDREDAVLN